MRPIERFDFVRYMPTLERLGQVQSVAKMGSLGGPIYKVLYIFGRNGAVRASDCRAIPPFRISFTRGQWIMRITADSFNREDYAENTAFVIRLNRERKTREHQA